MERSDSIITLTSETGSPKYSKGGYSSNKGHLNKSKDAVKKCQRYLTRLFRVNQMDFEFASWQMVYLILNPKKVYVILCWCFALFFSFPFSFLLTTGIATFSIASKRRTSLLVMIRHFWCCSLPGSLSLPLVFHWCYIYICWALWNFWCGSFLLIASLLASLWQAYFGLWLIDTWNVRPQMTTLSGDSPSTFT